MSTDYHRVRELVTTLAPNELRELRDLIGYHLGKSSAPAAAGADSDQRMLWDELCSQMKRRGLRTMPYDLLVKSSRTQFAKFNQGAPDAISWIRRQFRPSTRAELLKAMGISVRCVLDNISRSRLPLTLSIVCQQIGDLPSYVDKQFPGYAGNNMLHVLLGCELKSGSLRRL